MESPIKFGTDGWRAVIAEDFTFANVRLCAQAVADYLKENGLARRGVVIGYDTRFASEDFAAASAEVMAANGIRAYLCSGATPTPVVSYGVTAHGAGGAIVITASHNPPAWNGFKYKSEQGASAPPEVVARLEKNIARNLSEGKKIERIPLVEALAEGLVERLDLAPVYIRHLAELVDIERLRQAGIKVVLDPMYGAGAGYLRALLGGGTTRVTEINGERNPIFPGMKQPEPIEVNLGKLQTTVRQEGARVGIATDGDADRLGIVDEHGTFLTTLQVLSLLALYLLDVRGERGAIVRTITTSVMLDQLGELYHVPVYRTAVGFKYVAPIMTAENALLGGEESGGYGFRGNVPERDGILAGLYFLDFMARTGKTPSQLLEYLYSKTGPHYFDRVDTPFPEEERPAVMARVRSHRPAEIEGVKVAEIDTTDGYRFILADKSWLLVRFSGTEPLLRIYAESSTPERVAKLLAYGKTVAGLK